MYCIHFIHIPFTLCLHTNIIKCGRVACVNSYFRNRVPLFPLLRTVSFLFSYNTNPAKLEIMEVVLYALRHKILYVKLYTLAAYIIFLQYLIRSACALDSKTGAVKTSGINPVLSLRYLENVNS